MIAAVLCVVVELFESAFSRHFLDVDAESLRDFAAADAFLVELKCDLVAFVACCFDAGIKDDPLDCHDKNSSPANRPRRLRYVR